MQGETGQACTRGQWNLRLADARHTRATPFPPPHGWPLLRSNIQGAFAAALGQPAPELEEAASPSRTVQGSAARPLADSSTKVAAEAGEPCAKVLTYRVSATAIFRCQDTQGAGKGGAIVSRFRGWAGNGEEAGKVLSRWSFARPKRACGCSPVCQNTRLLGGQSALEPEADEE